jgi:hypothetical protein
LHKTKWFPPLVAIFALKYVVYAIAHRANLLQMRSAFQASSPKLFSPAFVPGIFLPGVRVAGDRIPA